MSSAGLYPAMCLGKLPAFADFVRQNAATRETLALDEWIQHGLYHARQRLRTEWGASFESAPAYNFLFWPDNCDRFLVGYIHPSRDKSGRYYPFVAALLVDRVRYGARCVHTAPAAFAPFLADAQRFVSLALDGLDAREIAEQVRALSLPADPWNGEECYRRYLCDTTLADFCLRVWGGSDGSLNRTLFEGLADLLLPFRGRPIPQLSLGLRFPLSRLASQSCLETGFWLDLTLRMVGQPVTTPVLFWTTGTATPDPAAFLFFHPPAPQSFVYLMRPDLEADTICAVGRFKRVESGPERYKTLFGEASLHLDALLDRIAVIP